MGIRNDLTQGSQRAGHAWRELNLMPLSAITMYPHSQTLPEPHPISS